MRQVSPVPGQPRPPRENRLYFQTVEAYAKCKDVRRRSRFSETQHVAICLAVKVPGKNWKYGLNPAML
jgi:hypothetical protein